METVAMTRDSQKSGKIAGFGVVILGSLMIGLTFLPKKPNQCYDGNNAELAKTNAATIIFNGLILIGLGTALLRFNYKTGKMFISSE